MHATMVLLTALALGLSDLDTCRAEESTKPLRIVENGQAKAVIVVQNVIEERQVAVDEFTFPGKYNIPPRQWAQTLQTYLERITGAKLPIVEDGTDTKGPAIHVGFTEFVAGLNLPFDKHDRDAIFLKRVGDQVTLVGVDDWGSEMAVYDFLERVCGVRWLQPGALWEIVPENKTLAVDALNVVEEPSFKSRMFSGVTSAGLPGPVSKEGVAWMKRNRIRARYNFHHSLGFIITPSKYGKEHPEYFPYFGGERHVPKNDHAGHRGIQPCLTNSDVVGLCAQAAREFFDAFPKAQVFSMGVNDMGGFCECEACRKANEGAGYDDAGKKNYSFVYFSFLNKVCRDLAKTHPAKKLGCMAYASGTSVPPPFKLEPNLVVYVQPNDYSRYHFDKKLQAWSQKQFSEWSARVDTLGVYLWSHGRNVYIPKMPLKSIAEYLRMAYAHGARGYYSEEYPNWGLDAPELYIKARLLWNIESSPDEWLDEFCAKAFGKAAAPMAAFYRLNEQIWNTHDAPVFSMVCEYPNKPRDQFAIYTPARVDECNRHLAEALRLVADENARQRVLQVRKCFRLTEYYALREFVARNMANCGTLTPAKLVEFVSALNSMQHLTHGVEALIFDQFQNDFYSFFQGLMVGRNWKSGPRVTVVPMDPYYYEASGIIIENLVKAQVKAGDEEAGGDLATALRARMDGIESCVNEQALNPNTPIAIQPAWDVLKQQLDNYLKGVTVAGRMKNRPTIDGRADEADWQRISPLGLVHNISKKGYGTKLVDMTSVRVGYDDDALYIAYVCDEDTKKLITKYDGRDTSVWRDDSIDFVLLPRGTAKSDYFHFILNSAGACFDATGNGGREWNGEFQAATGKDQPKGTWTVEMAIPWETLGRKAVSGEVWRAQFGRTNTDGSGAPEHMVFSAWVPSTSFNNADYLGVITFE